jgi:hypothetical protein
MHAIPSLASLDFFDVKTSSRRWFWLIVSLSKGQLPPRAAW